MSKNRKARIITSCVADRYTGVAEKIIEFVFPDGSGGLISFYAGEDSNRIDIYRLDKKIDVVVGKSE
jgi:hypothetical protein